MILLKDEHSQNELPFSNEQVLAFENLCLRLTKELLPSSIPPEINFEQETIAAQLIAIPRAESMDLEERNIDDRSTEALARDVTVLWAEREGLRSRIEGACPSTRTKEDYFTAGYIPARKHLQAMEAENAGVSRRLLIAHLTSLFGANHWLASLGRATEGDGRLSSLDPGAREVIFALIDQYSALQMEHEYIKMALSDV